MIADDAGQSVFLLIPEVNMSVSVITQYSTLCIFDHVAA